MEMRFFESLEERALIDTKKIWSNIFEMHVDINQKLKGDIFLINHKLWTSRIIIYFW